MSETNGYDIGAKVGIEGEKAFNAQVKAISAQVRALGSAMKELDEKFKTNADSQEALTSKQKLLQKAVETSQTHVDLLRKKFEKEARVLEELAGKLDEVTKKEGANKEEIEKAQVAYFKQAEAVQKADSALSRAESTLAKNKRELSEHEQAMKDAGKSTETMADAMDDAGKKTSVFADVLKANLLSEAIVSGVKALADGFRQIGDAAAGFLKEAVSVGSEFDHTMSSVAAISGATGDAFTALREEAIKMGGMTKFSANEAAEALTYMAMAGWKDEDMLNGLKGIMDLAAASGTDLARTSDIVTDAMTAFGLTADGTTKIIQDGIAREISNVTHFADVLAQASANSNTNVDLLGESFKYAAPSAGALGYSIEDVAVALGLMANQGVKASRAGTALNTLFTNMAKPSDDMKDAMDILGVSLDDGAGNMYSFMEVMEQLRAGFGDIKMPLEEFNRLVEQTEGDFEAGALSEKEYGDRMAELIHRAYGAEGALKAEAAAMLSGKRGMAGLLAIVNSSDEDFEKLTQAISEASYEIDGFSGAAERMSHIAEDNLQGDMTALNSAMETLKIRIADELTPTLRNFAQFGVASVREITAAFEQDGLSGAIDVLGQRVAEGITGIAERIPDMVELGGKFLAAIGEGIANNLPRIRDAFGGAINELRESLPDMLTFGVDMLKNIGQGILTAIPNLTSAATELMASFGGYLSEHYGDLVKTGLEFVLNLTGSIRESAGKLVDGAIALAKSLAKGLADSIPTIVENVPTIVSNIAGVINDNAPKILAAGIEIIITLVKGIIQAIPTIIKEMPKIVQAIADVITAFNWLNLGKQIMTFFKNGITGMIANVKNAGKQIADGIRDTLKNLPNTLKTIGKDGITSLGNGIRNMKSTALNAAKTILNTVKDKLAELPGAAIEIGKDLISGIWTGITDKLSWLGTQVSGGVDFIKGLFTGKSGFDERSPSHWSEDVFARVLKGGAIGFRDALPDTLKTARKTIQKIQDAMEFGEEIGTYASAPAAVSDSQSAVTASGVSGYYPDAETLAQAIRSALSGVGIYASGQRIGSVVDRVQRNNLRAAGSQYV